MWISFTGQDSIYGGVVGATLRRGMKAALKRWHQPSNLVVRFAGGSSARLASPAFNGKAHGLSTLTMILEILDRPIAFHRCLAQLTGSINAGLLLSQAVFWQRRCKAKDGWWWKTFEEWFEEIMMARRDFEQARTDCAPFLKHELRNWPAKSWYRVEAKILEHSLRNGVQTDCLYNGVQTDLYDAVQTEKPLIYNGTKTTSKTTQQGGFQQLIPETLRTPKFIESWRNWETHRKEIRCKLTPLSVKQQFKFLESLGPEKAVASIERSITNSWQGLFPLPKVNGHTQPLENCI
jgi:hypothetical protein